MRAQEIYKIAFNPEISTDKTIREIFKSRTASVLWCAIKTGHITDQFFTKKVLMCAETIDAAKEEFPEGFYDYDYFLRLVAPLSETFGVISVDGERNHVDNEFWSDIYNMIRGNRYRLFKIEYTYETEQSTADTGKGT